MGMSFDKALGIHESATLVRNQRAEVLAANLANADTPNYKARDIDFQAMLKSEVAARDSLSMRTTHSNHIQIKSAADGALQYRIPNQASIDGNTVDATDEQSRFAENSTQYLASLRFLGDRFSGLKSALRGE